MFHWLQLADQQPWMVVLELLYMAFMIWMLVDAYQRGAEGWWFFVIFFFWGIGPWVYFFAVKIRDFRLTRNRFSAAGSPQWRRLSLDELRYRAERMPTVVNRLALAERLMEKGQHRDAVPLLDAILKAEPGYCPALHELAQCHLACGEPAQALPVLQRLLERDRRWSDYRAWKTLLEVYDALEQPEQALQTMRELAKMVPTLENSCHLADRLLEGNQKGDAAKVLDQALTDYQYSPLGARWRNWRWARQARLLLKDAEAEEAVGP
jgi:hypothetical protein